MAKNKTPVGKLFGLAKTPNKNPFFETFCLVTALVSEDGTILSSHKSSDSWALFEALQKMETTVDEYLFEMKKGKHLENSVE